MVSLKRMWAAVMSYLHQQVAALDCISHNGLKPRQESDAKQPAVHNYTNETYSKAPLAMQY